MCEFNPELPIYLVSKEKLVKETSLAKLLPDCFSPKRMTFDFFNGKK
jgi:cytidine deaminase